MKKGLYFQLCASGAGEAQPEGDLRLSMSALVVERI
jgi:hypothetical protein